MTVRHSALVFILLLSAFLRLFHVYKLPSGLYWDEIDVGYQALSLLTTGKDYFGNTLPVFLHSFADYREPVFLYSAVPLVKIFGFSAFGIRIVPVIWGMLGIIAMYVLGQKTFKAGWISALLLGVSMWHMHYSRMTQEPIAKVTCLIVATAAMIFAKKNSKWFVVSMLFFALTIASYSIAKLFVPMWLLVLLVKYRPKMTLSGLFVFLVVATPLYIDALMGNSNSRFGNLAIFTDPTTATEINHKRQESQIGFQGHMSIGQSPNLMDKFSYNKPEEWLSRILKNYVSSFSTDFLFIKGDDQLRHSPSQNSIGMLYLVEIIPFVIGLYALIKIKSSRLVLFSWLLFAPIPASLTRDGGTHASRLILMLPVLLLIVTMGMKKMIETHKKIAVMFLIVLMISVTNSMYYYFTRYAIESEIPFQWGYDIAIKRALQEKSRYDQVIVDVGNDSALMAYLLVTQMPPQSFHTLLPLKIVEIMPDVMGEKFDNIILLKPGIRNWTNYQPKIHTLIIAPSNSPLLDSYKDKKETIIAPSGKTAFYIIERG